MTPTLLPKGVHLALLRGVSDAAGGPQSPGVHLLRTTLPRETRFNAATVRLFRLLLARTAAAARGSQSPESRPQVQTPNWPPVLWVLPGLGVLFEGVSATGLVVLLPIRPSRFASLLLLARRRRLRDGVAHSRRRWRQLLCVVSDLKGTVSRASGCRAPLPGRGRPRHPVCCPFSP